MTGKASSGLGKIFDGVQPLVGIVLVVILIFVIGTVFFPRTQHGPIQPPSSPKSPITLELSISRPPGLGEQATLTISLISTEPAPFTVVQVTPSDGFELVSGSPSWTVNLQPKREQIFTLPIKAVKNGYWTISVFAEYVASLDYRIGDTKRLHLQVADKFGALGISPSNQEGEYLIQITPPSR